MVSVRSYGIRQPLICVPAVRNKRCFVDSCSLTKSNGSLSQLHSADDEALLAYASRAIIRQLIRQPGNGFMMKPLLG